MLGWGGFDLDFLDFLIFGKFHFGDLTIMVFFFCSIGGLSIPVASTPN